LVIHVKLPSHILRILICNVSHNLLYNLFSDSQTSHLLRPVQRLANLTNQTDTASHRSIRYLGVVPPRDFLVHNHRPASRITQRSKRRAKGRLQGKGLETLLSLGQPPECK
jgi:hypothetical protein